MRFGQAAIPAHHHNKVGARDQSHLSYRGDENPLEMVIRWSKGSCARIVVCGRIHPTSEYTRHERRVRPSDFMSVLEALAATSLG